MTILIFEYLHQFSMHSNLQLLIYRLIALAFISIFYCQIF